MRVRFGSVFGICLAIVIGMVMTLNVFGQGKASKAPKAEKMSNVQGKVGKVDKDTITVLVGTAPKPVMINADTKFMMGHSNDSKPGSLTEVKQGNFIACSGTMDAKSQFMAKQCVYRDKQ